MLKRYPHTAKIITKATVKDANGDYTASTTEQEIVGRYEPSSGGDKVNYSAVFYCQILALEPFKTEESTLVYQGQSFAITQLHNYQLHCEIWLT